ncbi:MAG: SIMPL domain-containing protein, partial [Dehalococcoidia bacterium]
RVDNISFTIDDPTPLYAQARERAVLDAKAKAEQLAELSGITLGKPIYISVSTGRVPVAFEMRAEAAAPVPAPAAPPPISPGETEIRINVQMVFAIQ